jgi:nitrite reductase (NADH) small subunit
VSDVADRQPHDAAAVRRTTGAAVPDVVDDRIRPRAGRAAAPATGQQGAEPVEWTRVCRLDQLTPGRGAVARVRGDQVALFRVRTADDEDEVFALGNLDPFSGAQVLSRGIVGDGRGVPKVTSPVYKQGFELRTGACLDDPAVSVPSYPVTVSDEGLVSVGVPAP